MHLTDYVRKIFLRWRVIAATLILAISATAALSFSMTPMYESTARVFVSSSMSSGDLGAQVAASVYAQQRVLSYAAVASSSTMASRVIDSLNLDETPAEVASKVSTAVEFGTVLITLTVSDSSPTRATDIAKAIIDNYNLMLNRIDSSASGDAPIAISIMEPPSSPTSPVSPNVALNMVAAIVVGLLLGLALAALRDLLDDTVKIEVDGESLGGVPMVGAVSERKSARFLRGGAEVAPLVAIGEHSATAESLRHLRTNLRFAAIDRSPKTILVTSTRPGEGKSFIASGLASVYAANGQSVILVDLDLRRPVQAKRLGLEAGVGVTSVLVGLATLDKVIQRVPDAGFDLLASGPLPPNPTEVVATNAMHQLLQALAERYDAVIVDSPPVGLFDDARQIARVVDGTIVVTRNKQTRRQQVDATVKEFLDIDARVLGTVINFAPPIRSGLEYYGYYDVSGEKPRTHRA